MRRIILLVFTFLLPLTIYAQSPGLQQKAEALASNQVFENATIGIQVTNYSGETLAAYNGNKMLIPASNMKLISTGIAIHKLGPNYRFKTQIAYEGSIQDGVLHGDLYIIGGGDPTIGSKDSIAASLNSVFGKWEKAIRKAGINKIEGRIIGDGRWLDGTIEEPSWQLSDLGTYYGSGVTGLMFYENMISFNISAGADVGDDVIIEQLYPSTSWMTFRHACCTGKKGTGDKLYMITSEFAPIAEFRGTFAVDRSKKTIDCSNKFPEYTCAVYFKNYLEQKGITCTDGAADFRLKTEWLKGKNPPEGYGVNGEELKVIGTTYSPNLERITFSTNHVSNNLYADLLLRAAGKNMTGKSHYDSAYVAMNAALKELQVNTSQGFKALDGSGLSRKNHISPDFFCRFLKAMMNSPHFDSYIGTLPTPGANGTLKSNMKKQPESLKSRIRVKSGSMDGVRCYSGYILPEGYEYKRGESIPEEIKKKIIIFSVMTNNCTSSKSRVRHALDNFMSEIAQ